MKDCNILYLWDMKIERIYDMQPNYWDGYSPNEYALTHNPSSKTILIVVERTLVVS